MNIILRGLTYFGGAVLTFLVLWTLCWIVLGLSFRPSISHFEANLNRIYDGYRSHEGRVIRCSSWEEDYSEYYVRCRYFRDGAPEEETYHAFDKWGTYIGSRDGG